MNRVSLRFLVFPCCALLLSGCGSTATKPAVTYGTQSLNGDWRFLSIDDFYSQSPIGTLSGGLSGQGADITGILHSAGGCVPATQDINFTGTEDAKGNVVLTSTNLPNNVATISGSLLIFADGLSLSSKLVVTGSGPCAGYWDGFMGNPLNLLNGAYTAALTSTNGATATLSAAFTSGTANAELQFPESGTATLTSASCTSTIALNGLATGVNVNGTLTQAPSGSNSFAVELDSGAITLNNPSATCNGGSFSGSLVAPQ